MAGAGRASLRAWSWIAVGLFIGAVADVLYLYAEARSDYVQGGLLDALWPAGALVVAMGAWRQPVEVYAPGQEGWRRLSVAISFGLLALAVEIYATSLQ